MSDDIIKFIRRRDYQYIVDLGKGSCGKTVLLYDNVIEQHFVCKKFDPHDPSLKDELYPNFLNEIRLMHQTYHPNVVRIFGYHVEPQLHIGYIIMEYVEGDEIDSYIKENPESLESVFLQTIEAFRYLEENKILHRDLRTQNILVRNDGVVKIIDLGFGKAVCNDADFKKSISLNWPFTWPEEFHSQTYDFRTEVYAVGKLFKQIMAHHGLSDKTVELVVERMCAENPTNRISSFADAQLALNKNNMEAPRFSELEISKYRDFSSSLTMCLSGIDLRSEYITDLTTITSKLEVAYQACMLEEETQVNAIARCFLARGTIQIYSAKRFKVEHLKNFIELLKAHDSEGQRIIVANIHSRLDTIDRFDDEIPF